MRRLRRSSSARSAADRIRPGWPDSPQYRAAKWTGSGACQSRSRDIAAGRSPATVMPTGPPPTTRALITASPRHQSESAVAPAHSRATSGNARPETENVNWTDADSLPELVKVIVASALKLLPPPRAECRSAAGFALRAAVRSRGTGVNAMSDERRAVRGRPRDEELFSNREHHLPGRLDQHHPWTCLPLRCRSSRRNGRRWKEVPRSTCHCVVCGSE